jgi:hypothetical protein
VKIVIAGGTGWLGSALAYSLLSDRHDVVALTRSASSSPSGTSRRVQWDGRTVADWATELDDAEAIVNFAGASIGEGRWTAARKRILYASRIDSTTALVAALEQAGHRPEVLANVSAVGYYGDRGEDLVTETDPPGADFLARLAADWEAAAAPARALGVRVAILRLGLVLGPDGGALPRLAAPFRFFVGGPLGTGKQWVSWVHIDDVVGLFRFALERPDVVGPINVTAPAPARNRDFSATVARALGRPSWLPVPGIALRLVLGEIADSLLGGQRVAPTLAERLGYRFREPSLLPALERIFETRYASDL